ncbi:MAG: hypothetical protein FWC50_02430, partial [Planctomycetaceae bacterium]|nr:hypothetical protein [Planctomycetaceae bacterium]
SSRLKIPEAGHGKPCNAGRLREAEGCRPYRLRYKSLTAGKLWFPNGSPERKRRVFRDNTVKPVADAPGCHSQK